MLRGKRRKNTLVCPRTEELISAPLAVENSLMPSNGGWWVELPQLVPEIFGNAQRYFEARYRNSDARYRYFEVRYQYFEARYRFSDLSPLCICNFFTSQNSCLKGCMVPLFAFVRFSPLCVLKCFLTILRFPQNIDIWPQNIDI